MKCFSLAFPLHLKYHKSKNLACHPDTITVLETLQVLGQCLLNECINFDMCKIIDTMRKCILFTTNKYLMMCCHVPGTFTYPPGANWLQFWTAQV